jgi:steroid 5-alpha reductase family enzyme
MKSVTCCAMLSAHVFVEALAVIAAAALCTWVVSLFRHNVAIVDSPRSLMFKMAAFIYARAVDPLTPRAVLVLCLVSAWGLRLSIYISARNRGHGEDRRYQAIRARNQPHFELKSLYLVFALQAVLAWIISLPLFGAIMGAAPLGISDASGGALWLVGFSFEAGCDWQLARFKSNPANRGRVLDRGFWRYTRHPNYFGDFCVWWGFYLMAASAGGWWTFVGPCVMSMLLMRVSGVKLLERDIGDRRPQYADYVRRTNTFFPGAPRRKAR